MTAFISHKKITSRLLKYALQIAACTIAIYSIQDAHSICRAGSYWYSTKNSSSCNAGTSHDNYECKCKVSGKNPDTSVTPQCTGSYSKNDGWNPNDKDNCSDTKLAKCTCK